MPLLLIDCSKYKNLEKIGADSRLLEERNSFREAISALNVGANPINGTIFIGQYMKSCDNKDDPTPIRPQDVVSWLLTSDKERQMILTINNALKYPKLDNGGKISVTISRSVINSGNTIGSLDDKFILNRIKKLYSDWDITVSYKTNYDHRDEDCGLEAQFKFTSKMVVFE